ncbi:MAG: DUF21 domain-containing protein [Chlamydiota bacterium]
MSAVYLFLLSMLFLSGTFLLTALSGAFRSIHKRGSEKQLDALGDRFFYRKLHTYFFPENEYEGLFFAATCAQNSTRFFYASTAIAFLYKSSIFQNFINTEDIARQTSVTYTELVLIILGFLILSFVLGDYIPRILGTHYPERSLQVCAPLSSLFLLVSFPITYIFLRLTRSFSRTVYFDHLHEPDTQAKQEIIEIVQEAELSEE